MERDHNKPFCCEKASITLHFEWAGCFVPKDVLPLRLTNTPVWTIFLKTKLFVGPGRWGRHIDGLGKTTSYGQLLG